MNVNRHLEKQVFTDARTHRSADGLTHRFADAMAYCRATAYQWGIKSRPP
ncbi:MULTISPECIES: hypothetical protein [Bacteroidaceae]|nr:MULTISPECIES: hypothetical protein [Bacteroides]